MADGDYVEPLTGEEVIIDLCAQIAEKLRSDCNLRASDSYQGGYSARATVHVECYGMDTATVDVQVTTGKPQENPDELIDITIEVPVETALDQVRERSEQPVPTLSNEGGEEVIRPRRYVRRERVVAGGATGEAL
jgi:hypothetical protein